MTPIRSLTGCNRRTGPYWLTNLRTQAPDMPMPRPTLSYARMRDRPSACSKLTSSAAHRLANSLIPPTPDRTRRVANFVTCIAMPHAKPDPMNDGEDQHDAWTPLGETLRTMLPGLRQAAADAPETTIAPSPCQGNDASLSMEDQALNAETPPAERSKLRWLQLVTSDHPVTK